MALPSCSAFTSRTNFEDYIGVLRNVTHGDFSLVRECRSEICSALWGSGNPDISGIGMAIGYILESFIALLLVIASLWNIRSRGGERTGWLADLLLSNAATTFYDNAIYFTLAIQVASVITLARANFGISADGMGAITMKIAWLVSTLTLMPLMTMVLRPQMFSERRDDGEDDGERHDNTYAEEAEKAEGDETKCRCEKQSTAISEARQRQRFLLFVLCWAMSFYPFFSRMAGTFGESQIGDSPEAVISPVDWGMIQSVCFDHVPSISPESENLITAFGIIGWLMTTIVVLYKVILSAIKAGYERQWKWLQRHNLVFDSDTPSVFRSWLSLCFVVFVVLVVQFWAFFRLRRFQADMTKAAGGDFSDGQFSFGQIVAIVLFVPVLVEVLFLWKQKSLYSKPT